ncbi:MAG: 50S ribosomal protein L13 [Candidatus Moranbacteria bacterium RIFOXYB1_FULL_43_19]|nr:MAG: 50S ribosomal protein L13 [Candidatus Moranbacteria bacterium RIFOXYB1_FULL_43_19]OGI28622.1 MAG: 50S ribosomal protein L13 [Candidatus Moranbacteria bacterium RIFOXYA1_FULL_44_7]OGI33785.1 MAG: 50S ribosomal protein L13 [Candidatus Moranbacteria bacterium RIFOXYC1_FULL_44_13]OGI38733.1 MAG: 50S ribosomal protein L13 [Candidatus Moranbacteria bacterium RIFOXYD1_FULL_44_12]
MKTANSVKRKYHLFDCEKEYLGRIATRAAFILQGKQKADFASHIDGGDFAVFVNAAKLRLSGKKMENKIYHSFSGYPGGIKSRKAADIMKINPEKIIRDAIYGMLPKNKLRPRRMKRILVFPDADHKLKVDFVN